MVISASVVVTNVMLCVCKVSCDSCVQKQEECEKKRPTGNLMGSVHVHTVLLNSLHLYLTKKQKQQETNKRSYSLGKGQRNTLTDTSIFHRSPTPRNDREEKEERAWERGCEQVGITNNKEAVFNVLKWGHEAFREIFDIWRCFLCICLFWKLRDKRNLEKLQL